MSEPDNLSPQAAFDLLRADARAILVDIRSTMEFLFVGHPVGATHIAWIDEPDWEPDTKSFVREIEQQCSARYESDPKSVPVILICRSGKRTLEAGEALLDAGFHSVKHVDEGFEGDRDDRNHRGTLGGWRFRGLPWEQC